MLMTQFENAACNVCLINVMIYTGNGKGHGKKTVKTYIKEGDEEMMRKNTKGEKR